MSDADKYLKQLNELKDSQLHEQEVSKNKKIKEEKFKKFKSIRQMYKTGIPTKTGGHRLGISESEYFLGDRPRSVFQGYAAADAKEYFGEDYHASGDDRRKVTEEEFSRHRGKLQMVAYDLIKGGWQPNHFILGARLYEKLGKGNRIIPRLLKKVQEAEKRGEMTLQDYEKVKQFIKRNADKKHSNLESRVGVFILFTLGGIILSISSLTQTGSAISNLIGTSKGLLGLIFFVLGLAGIFFSKKR